MKILLIVLGIIAGLFITGFIVYAIVAAIIARKAGKVFKDISEELFKDEQNEQR